MPEITSIQLRTGKLDALMLESPLKAHSILDKIAFDVEGGAKQEALVDTGAMRASGYVSGASGGRSDYGQSTGAARSRNPKAKIVSEVKPAKAMERIVGFSVNYAFWVHVKHKPFLAMAVEQQRPQATAAWKELLN